MVKKMKDEAEKNKRIIKIGAKSKIKNNAKSKAKNRVRNKSFFSDKNKKSSILVIRKETKEKETREEDIKEEDIKEEDIKEEDIKEEDKEGDGEEEIIEENAVENIEEEKGEENKAQKIKKNSLLYNLLLGDSGITLDELMKILGWQKHSLRGVMSNLQKQLGFSLVTLSTTRPVFDSVGKVKKFKKETRYYAKTAEFNVNNIVI
jgi:hypothetical protein